MLRMAEQKAEKNLGPQECHQAPEITNSEVVPHLGFINFKARQLRVLFHLQSKKMDLYRNWHQETLYTMTGKWANMGSFTWPGWG